MTNIRTKLAAAVGSLLLSAVLARAQVPLSNLVVTVGTTIQDTNGNNWSYVLIGAPQMQLLAGKQFCHLRQARCCNQYRRLHLAGDDFPADFCARGLRIAEPIGGAG